MKMGPATIFTYNHSTGIDYQSNIAGEVKLWTVNGSSIDGSGSYAPGTFYKNQTTDENGNKSWEYKDLQNRVILKQVEDNYGVFLNTYYVYDDLDHLRYVIPPKATTNSYTEGDPGFNELLYAYHYDERERVIEKHIPGAGWINMVYNNIDQLILSQDENQRVSNKWIFTKYDAFGRVVMTGRTVIDSTRINIQDRVIQQPFGKTATIA